MKILFDEVKGKEQGNGIIVEAETPQLAIEKLKEHWEVVEVIKPYERFSQMHFGGKIYIAYEWGYPSHEFFVVYLRKKQG